MYDIEDEVIEPISQQYILKNMEKTYPDLSILYQNDRQHYFFKEFKNKKRGQQSPRKIIPHLADCLNYISSYNDKNTSPKYIGQLAENIDETSRDSRLLLEEITKRDVTMTRATGKRSVDETNNPGVVARSVV